MSAVQTTTMCHSQSPRSQARHRQPYQLSTPSIAASPEVVVIPLPVPRSIVLFLPLELDCLLPVVSFFLDCALPFAFPLTLLLLLLMLLPLLLFPLAFC